MTNDLQNTKKITGMKRGGANPQQPMYEPKHATLKRAMHFLDTHKKANAPKKGGCR